MTNDEREWTIRELTDITNRLVNGEHLDLAEELDKFVSRELLEIEVIVPPHLCGDHVIDVLEDFGCEIS